MKPKTNNSYNQAEEPANDPGKKTGNVFGDATTKNPPGLADYLGDFTSAFDYLKTNYHPLWLECYRLYRQRRVRIGYEGYSDAFVPEGHTIIESLTANIAGGKPKFDYLPTNMEQSQDVAVLQHITNYVWDANHMDVKSQIWVREMLIYGTSILYVTWDTTLSIPCITNIPIYDFFFDPTAKNAEDARYMGFRYLAHRADLARQKVVDPKTGAIVNKYDLSNVKDIGGNSNMDDMDKAKKDLLSGSTITGQAAKDLVEVIKIFYVDGTCVELGNRMTVIWEGDSPYQQPEKKVEVEVEVQTNGGITFQKSKMTLPAIKPFFPFAVLRDYIDPSLFLGVGEMEIIKSRQETLNDLENMDLDNAAYANNIMWQVDPMYADMMPEIVASPGIVIPIPQGALQPIQRPQTQNDLVEKKMQVQEEMRRATAADEVIQGVSQNQGRITATEINNQLTQSHQRFSTKINNLEAEGYATLAKILLRCLQIFLTQKTAVRIIGDEGTQWKDFDPNSYFGEYEPHVKLDTTVKQMKMEQGQKLNQMYQLMLGNGYIDQREALRFIFRNLGASQEDIQKLINNGPIPPKPLNTRVNIALKGVLPPDQETQYAQIVGLAQNPAAQGQPNAPTGLPGSITPQEAQDLQGQENPDMLIGSAPPTPEPVYPLA